MQPTQHFNLLYIQTNTTTDENLLHKVTDCHKSQIQFQLNFDYKSKPGDHSIRVKPDHLCVQSITIQTAGEGNIVPLTTAYNKCY